MELKKELSSELWLHNVRLYKGIEVGYCGAGWFLLCYIDILYPNKNIYELSDKSFWILSKKIRIRRYKLFVKKLKKERNS